MASEVVEDGRHRGTETGHGTPGVNHGLYGDRDLNNQSEGAVDKAATEVGQHEGQHEGHHDGHHHDHDHDHDHEGKPRFLHRAPSNVPKEYETRVQIISRFPELKTVDETYYVKEIRNEKRIVKIPRTRVVMEEHEHIEKVPVIKEVERTRKEIVHRVVEEEREITEKIKIVEMVDVPRRQTIPRVVTEEIEEEVEVPTLVDVPKIRKKEVHTGNYLEAHAGEYVNPGHFNLLGKGHGILKHGFGSKSSSSSSSDDDEKKAKKGHGLHMPGAVRTHRAKGGSRSSSSSPDRKGISAASNSAPTTPQKSTAKKKSLLQRIEAKFV